MLKNINILIAGGGTGGHLFPAFAIGNKLEKEGANVTYIGSKYGIEKKYKSKMNTKLYLLNIKGIHRNLSLKSLISNFLFPFRFIYSYIISLIIIKRIKPDIIIGTGGYSSGLPLLAGISLSIKSFIHEQNAYPGFTTRFLSKKVEKVFIPFNGIKKYIPSDNCILTGNPIRENLRKINRKEACKKIGLNANKKIIFILGGSQGSRPFNLFFIKYYKELINKNIQIIWQTGILQFDEIQNSINNPAIIIKPFINKIDIAYSCSDIVISRAGAIAIEELKAFGKPMILIPYPNSANNHQEFNAKELSNSNAAELIDQQDMKLHLLNKINYLLKNEEHKNVIGNNARRLHNSNSLDIISKSLKEYARV